MTVLEPDFFIPGYTQPQSIALSKSHNESPTRAIWAEDLGMCFQCLTVAYVAFRHFESVHLLFN